MSIPANNTALLHDRQPITLNVQPGAAIGIPVQQSPVGATTTAGTTPSTGGFSTSSGAPAAGHSTASIGPEASATGHAKAAISSLTAPQEIQKGTAPEHVDNLAKGIAGAVITAPLAAVEAISPTVSNKLSNATSTLSQHATNLASTVQGHAQNVASSDTTQHYANQASSQASNLATTATNLAVQAKDAVLNSIPTSLVGAKDAVLGSIPTSLGGTKGTGAQTTTTTGSSSTTSTVDEHTAVTAKNPTGLERSVASHTTSARTVPTSSESAISSADYGSSYGTSSHSTPSYGTSSQSTPAYGTPIPATTATIIDSTSGHSAAHDTLPQAVSHTGSAPSAGSTQLPGLAQLQGSTHQYPSSGL